MCQIAEQLLQKDASRRLGSGPNGSDELKQQKWFKSINWHKLEAREIVPKFIPAVSGKNCTVNFDEIWTNLPIDDSPASTPKAGDCNYFRGYTYVAPNAWLD
jgi:p70 ribosomal S6 kinase